MYDLLLPLGIKSLKEKCKQTKIRFHDYFNACNILIEEENVAKFQTCKNLHHSDTFSVNKLLKFTLTQIKILQFFGKIAKSNARGIEAILVRKI